MLSRLAAICIVVVSLGSHLAEAAPTVTQIVPLGLQSGGKTIVTLRGTQLDQADPRLLSPLISNQKVLKATAVELQLEVEVAADETPGLYRFRLANQAGVSNAWIGGVDALVELPFQTMIESAPVALTGTLAGGAILETKLHLEAGDDIVAEVECRRLGGQARPVLRLLDPNGVQVNWGPYRSTPFGDSRLVGQAAMSGEFTVQLHDLLYKAPSSPFRLKVGNFRFAAMTFPLAAESLDKTIASFVDSNISATDVTLWQSPTFPTGIAVARPNDTPLVSGPLPQVRISGYTEWIEGQEGTIPAAPVGLNGRLDVAHQTDVFRVPVTAGQTIRCEVTAHRVGSPVDAVLAIKAVNGGALGQNDDTGNRTDPVVEAKIPAGVTEIEVSIRDLTGRGGPINIYRIAVVPIGQPAFTLKVAKAEVGVPADGRQLLEVTVQRQGYNGPINLSAQGVDGKPRDLQFENSVIPPGVDKALVMLRRSSLTADIVLLKGQGEQGGKVLTSLAQVDSNAKFENVVPGASTDLAVWTGTPTPIAVTDPVVPAEPYQGQLISLPTEVTRAESGVGPIRFRLVSSQAMPRKKIKEGNADKEVDDVDRALRIDGETMWAADKSAGMLRLLIPTDLASKVWEVALVAEQLSADQKNVLSTSYGPVHILTPAAPYRVELTSGAEIATVAGVGDVGQFTGRVHRREGFAEVVTVRLQGLPEGYESPSIDVPANVTDFSFPVKFSDKAKPAKLDKVSLIAHWKPIADKPQQTFKSNAVAVKLDVQPGDKAPNP
jgi:hypothetical protein